MKIVNNGGELIFRSFMSQMRHALTLFSEASKIKFFISVMDDEIYSYSFFS